MPAVSAQTDTITNSVSSLLTDTVLPQSIDLKQDISHLSFRNYGYYAVIRMPYMAIILWKRISMLFSQPIPNGTTT